MRPRSALAVPVLLTLTHACSAGVHRHDRDEAYHLALAQESRFQAAGALILSGFGAFASGTLIAPDWVLTAAHATDVANASQISFSINGMTYTGAESFAHPAWTGNVLEGYDISLIRLTQPVAGIDPAEVYAGSDVVGRLGMLVGYGMGGNGVTGEQPETLGVKRAGPNMLDANATAIAALLGIPLSANNLIIDFDGPNLPGLNRIGSAAPLDREFFPGHGDSGGAYWIEDTDGRWKLASIQSWGTLNFPNDIFGRYGHIAASARLDEAIPWIRDVTGIPSPSTGLLLCAATVMPASRRRTS